MSSPHKTGKIISPALPPAILYRESLAMRLNEVIAKPAEGFSHYKLVLLYAPAGYGKTTLLADFARHTHIPCCWYVLDHTDTDKITFLKCLIASIRYRFPSFGTILDALVASAIAMEGSHHLEAVLDALIAAIETECTERFALFLCNYQEVNEYQEINELVNYLLYRLPTNCVLVIESRATPDLEFASLLARRQMVGMGSNLLRFSVQELCALAQLQGMVQLIEAEAEQLVEAFEGWITGMLLGSRLGDGQFLRQKNSAFHVSGNQGLQMDQQHLFSYIVNEVFQRNPETYAFLKEASVLQEMTPSLCSKLLNISNADERLHYLEQNGLFVTSRGEGAKITYICHPVLRELLYDELRHQSPKRFSELHRRAAEILGKNQDYEKAVYHALEASADGIAAHLILDSYDQMMNQGYMETLARWIDVLPPDIMFCYPRLLLLRATIHLLAGDHTNALALLDEVSKAITQQPSPVHLDDVPLFQAECTILRSKALFQRGEYKQVQKLCGQMLQHLPADEVKLRAEVHMRLGNCANLLGNYTIGIVQLQKALQLWGRNTITYQTAQVYGALASTYNLIGNVALAEHHIARSITCWNQLHGEWGKINNLIRLGSIKQRQGALSEAEAAFTEALTLARGPINFLRGQAYALINLGHLYQDQEYYEKSLIALEDGQALARQVKDKYITNCALCRLALTYLYMGDASTALVLVSEVDVPQDNDEVLRYEVVLRELTHNTILLYQRRYDEAYTSLSKLQTSLNTIGLKQEQIQATLHLAACLLEQGKTSTSVTLMEEIIAQLKMQSGYEYLVLLELRRLHRLCHAIETLPEMVDVREQLPLAIERQEMQPLVEEKPAQQSIPMMVSQPSAQMTTSCPKIIIQALGEPLVMLQERSITRWRMARSMELFFFLLDCAHPMRKEQIITALWTEVDEQINQTFHSTVYYLRKALEVPCIVSQGSIYTLDLASSFGDNVYYDVAAFQQHQTTARQAQSEEDEEMLREALLAMVELYRGDYAQPFYNDWCTFRRDELRRSYLDARRQLARLAWHNEQFDESVLHWQYMLAIDDCLEDAHYGLMRCYIRQGKRGLALRQYQRCRDTLQRELAVLPGAAVQNLYQRLMGSN